jgi:hypothetical protein
VLYLSWGILIAQALYALAAALCFFNTRLSIALIVLLQLNYVVAPGFRETRAEESADS